MSKIQKIRKIGGIINSTDLNYNFDRMQEDLQLAVEGVIFKDGYSQVDTISDRNNIPQNVLIPGLWVAVAETGMVYEYDAKYSALINGETREFGMSGDLPEIPYIVPGDETSGIFLNAGYVCQIDRKDAEWKYSSAQTGIDFNDGDIAIYQNVEGTKSGHWVRFPTWIPILDTETILKNGLVGDKEDLHTDDKSTIVAAINEVHDDLGSLDVLKTQDKDTAVEAINEVNDNVGTLSSLTTGTKDSAVAAINELKSITDALRGAMIIIGRIMEDSQNVTQEALTARALEIMSATVVQVGWTLVDNEQHEWNWNGNSWQDLEQPNIYPAENGTLGTVRGAESGDVSITNGNMTVRHSANSDSLGGAAAIDYARKTDVLTKTNTEGYTPTTAYHPATKNYVDTKTWNPNNLIVGGSRPAAPASGYIIWIDLSK